MPFNCFIYFACVHMFLCVFVCVCVRVCMCSHIPAGWWYAHATELLWRSEDNLWYFVLSFLHVGPWDQTHVVRL